MQGADILVKNTGGSLLTSGQHKLDMQNFSFTIKDTKLRGMLQAVTAAGDLLFNGLLHISLSARCRLAMIYAYK